MNLLTKRIPTLIGLLLIVAGIFGYFYFFQGKTAKVSSEIVPSSVKITNIADNKFSVSWTTKIATVGSVEYGVVGDKITTKASDDRDLSDVGSYATHHVTIGGLQPDTQYAFRVLSGEKTTRFDNNGSPYTATTGPVISNTPVSVNFYGDLMAGSSQPAGGALVYMTLPNGATNSTLSSDDGNYTFTLSTMRDSSFQDYVMYDPSATIASLLIDDSKTQTISNVSLANSTPVPTLTLGNDEDFLALAQVADIAQVEPAIPAGEGTQEVVASEEVAEVPSIFNVEPLSGAEINAVTSQSLTILNPKDEGEILSTLRPEFRGTGPAGTTLSIALTGQKAISDTADIAADKTWSWSPAVDLKVGKQKITISYIATSGATEKLEREFSVSTSTSSLDPAFVASPSASTKATASASIKASSSPSPREAMPATDSGVPVTGVIENTLLTAALGIVIMVVGVALLAL